MELCLAANRAGWRKLLLSVLEAKEVKLEICKIRAFIVRLTFFPFDAVVYGTPFLDLAFPVLVR